MSISTRNQGRGGPLIIAASLPATHSFDLVPSQDTEYAGGRCVHAQRPLSFHLSLKRPTGKWKTNYDYTQFKAYKIPPRIGSYVLSKADPRGQRS